MDTAAAETPATLTSGIAVLRVRVRNFRCLRAVTAELGATSVLIGENNVGKTSFIDAIHAAIGSGVRGLSEDDIFLGQGESAPPKDRDITVDLLIRPVDANHNPLATFPEESPWTALWGNGIAQNDDGNDIVIIRARLAWAPSRGEYVTERYFLREWLDTEDAARDAPRMNAPLGNQQIEPLALFSLDAKRDVVDDLKSRSSLWGKLVSDPGLPADAVEKIEEALSQINETIVSGSAVLSHVESHLHGVAAILCCDEKGIAIAPVPRHLRDLNRGMDVKMTVSGSSSFPLARQGMGTRALATMLLFRAYMTWKQKTFTNDALHPFVSIEEPEVHLHPHAQRALFDHLRGIPGQCIISTHSPYVCSQASISEFLHFTKSGSDTRVTRFTTTDHTSGEQLLSDEDIRRINREVMNTRGDILYSRCMVLFEGETEEQAVPEFAKQYWSRHPNELGVSFVGVGGYGNYLPFLLVAKQFRIPWVILSDGETKAIAAVNSALSRAGEGQANAHPRVVLLPEGQTFESYLVTAAPEYVSVAREVIIDSRARNAHHREALRAEWQDAPSAAVIDELRSAKTQYGARIATGFRAMADPLLRIPERIRAALDLAVPAVDTGEVVP